MQIALNMRFCFGALTWSLFDLVNLDFGARAVGGMKIRASDLKFGAPISGPRGRIQPNTPLVGTASTLLRIIKSGSPPGSELSLLQPDAHAQKR